MWWQKLQAHEVFAGPGALIDGFISFLESKGWKVEFSGPFKVGETFEYLKRKITRVDDGYIIRANEKHIEEIAAEADIFKKKRKTTPGSDLSRHDWGDALEGKELTAFRSVVGKMLYIANERPDAQHTIQVLASKMSSPVTKSWYDACHLASNLFNTMDYGIKIFDSKKGKSVLDMRSIEDVEEKPDHMLEIVTDADYAGNQETRKSTTSYQIYMDGNLIEAKLRGQRSIALSSGESEYVAMVSGSSKGMFLRHMMSRTQFAGQTARQREEWSGASARVRHIDASLLWLQQRAQEKMMRVTAVPTAINCADIGTKILTKARSQGLMYMMNMVDGSGERIGEEQFKEIEKSMLNQKGSNMMMVVTLANLVRANGEPNEKKGEDGMSEWWMVGIAIWAVIGVLGLVNWTWRFFIRVIVNETNQKKKIGMHAEDEDSESDLWARKPTRQRKKRNMPEKDGIVKAHATGKVYHTSALCQHYKGGKSYPKCSVCAEHEGSMLDHQ